MSDHDPAFLELLQVLLQDEGYEALVPPKLEEPYPFIKAARPDAVVLDVPFRQETETLATLSKLRLDRATMAIPVVVSTTAPQELQGLQDRQAEGLYLLAKPFDLEQLLAILVLVLGSPPPRRTTSVRMPLPAATPRPRRPALAPPRRQRLLRLHQEVTALHGQLTAIREESEGLAAVEAMRPFSPAERRRVAQFRLQAEAVRLELLRLRAAVAEVLDERREGRSGAA